MEKLETVLETFVEPMVFLETVLETVAKPIEVSSTLPGLERHVNVSGGVVHLADNFDMWRRTRHPHMDFEATPRDLFAELVKVIFSDTMRKFIHPKAACCVFWPA